MNYTESKDLNPISDKKQISLRCIVPIVEGPGDVQATPILLRKILSERMNCYDIGIAKPKKAGGRSKLDRRDGIEKFVGHASRTPGCGGILILTDSDDDCAVEWAQRICVRCAVVGAPVPIAVVCAVREYENWFLASLESIKGNLIRGNVSLNEVVENFDQPEEVGGAKGWITRQMPQGRAYKETSDQASMTSMIDVSLAYANSRSFQRLCHAVEELKVAMEAGSSSITPF
ncbi:MAG: DUF4276 family protein [Chloroflexi bacterium]|nr:DUF4276 family protein [Chloroflexota bacterium]